MQTLIDMPNKSGSELIEYDVKYGKYLGKLTLDFIKKHNIIPDIISSHGHTIFHKPNESVTLQIGNGKMISKITNQKVVCDFRTQDVKFGGQGAPLVPIGDKHLFADYKYCLNEPMEIK